jgi:diaminopimelate epimerase
MLLEFTKMNGAGNDFVAIDNRERKISLHPSSRPHLQPSSRVGADV